MITCVHHFSQDGEDFTPTVLKDEDEYEGKEIDANIAAGKPFGTHFSDVVTRDAYPRSQLCRKVQK